MPAPTLPRLALPSLPALPALPARTALFRLATCALLATAAGTALAAGTAHLPAATDLGAHGAEAAQRGEPLVLLVSMPGCGYCDAVRRNYLGPQAAAGEIAVRELDLTAVTPLRDADGTVTTARDWARAHQVRVAPTVLFLDRQGRAAASPLRGMQPDFYGAYLEQALDQARAAVATRR
ncbi:thioredoxin [Cupriavidus sp. P-10]|uniref:thioredoxin fold domain-containing protein n=1 Tax=unclassified Cupriavidus TaxID=2640874 RepID=UPI001F28ECF7|nr:MULTISPECIES: thioredoxin fold domain-containing protein [unclassified Cupriavidus]BDB22926.1 thioredoxin [Cupriavidus sp. P-10]